MSRTSVARAWVQGVAAREFFSLDDVPGPRHSAENVLARLAAPDGTITRVKPGLYWKRPATGRFGTPRSPSPFAAAFAAAGPGTGPSGWAASNALGLSTQVPAVAEVAVVGRPPKGLPAVAFTSRSNVRRLGLGPLDIAVLEVLRSFPMFVELSLPDVLARIRDHAVAGRIDLAKIVWAAAAERRPAVRDRLAQLA